MCVYKYLGILLILDFDEPVQDNIFTDVEFRRGNSCEKPHFEGGSQELS